MRSSPFWTRLVGSRAARGGEGGGRHHNSGRGCSKLRRHSQRKCSAKGVRAPAFNWPSHCHGRASSNEFVVHRRESEEPSNEITTRTAVVFFHDVARTGFPGASNPVASAGSPGTAASSGGGLVIKLRAMLSPPRRGNGSSWDGSADWTVCVAAFFHNAVSQYPRRAWRRTHTNNRMGLELQGRAPAASGNLQNQPRERGGAEARSSRKLRETHGELVVVRARPPTLAGALVANHRGASGGSNIRVRAAAPREVNPTKNTRNTQRKPAAQALSACHGRHTKRKHLTRSSGRGRGGAVVGVRRRARWNT